MNAARFANGVGFLDQMDRQRAEMVQHAVAREAAQRRHIDGRCSGRVGNDGEGQPGVVEGR